MNQKFDVNLETKKVEVRVFTQTEAALVELEKKYLKVVPPDAKTDDGYAFLKDAVKEISGYRIKLEKSRIKEKAPYLEAGKIIDKEAKRITARLAAMEDPLASAKKIEDSRVKKEKEDRILEQQVRIDTIRASVDTMRKSTPDEIEAKITELNAIDGTGFWELKLEALEARNETINKLGELLVDAIERIRLEEQAAIDRKVIADAERKTAINDRIDKLKSIPLEMMESTSEQLKAKAASVASFKIVEADFGDRFEEVLELKATTVTRLDKMAYQAEMVEAAEVEAEQKKAKEQEALLLEQEEADAEEQSELLNEPVETVVGNQAHTKSAIHVFGEKTTETTGGVFERMEGEPEISNQQNILEGGFDHDTHHLANKGNGVAVLEEIPDPDYPNSLEGEDLGYFLGLRAYAWWSNSVEYVGQGEQTFNDAFALYMANK